MRNKPNKTTGRAELLMGCLVLAACLIGGCRRPGDVARGLKSRFRPPSVRASAAMAVDETDPDGQREGIMYLARSSIGKDVETLKLFATILRQSPEPMVRSAAVTALGMAGNREFLDDILKGLEDPDTFVRWDAAQALDNVIGNAAFQPLTTHARRDPSTDVRIACVKVLRHYRRRECVHVLTELMSAPQLSIRHQAHQSLLAIYGVDHGPDAEDWARAARAKIPVRPAPQQRLSWWQRFDLVGRWRQKRAAEEKADYQARQAKRDGRNVPAAKAEREKQSQDSADASGDKSKSWWQKFRQAQARRRQEKRQRKKVDFEELLEARQRRRAAYTRPKRPQRPAGRSAADSKRATEVGASGLPLEPSQFVTEPVLAGDDEASESSDETGSDIIVKLDKGQAVNEDELPVVYPGD